MILFWASNKLIEWRITLKFHIQVLYVVLDSIELKAVSVKFGQQDQFSSKISIVYITPNFIPRILSLCEYN